MQSIHATNRRKTFNIRINRQLNDLIERAAILVGSNRTDFVLDAVRRAAQDVLLDRSIFLMRAKSFRKFVARVSAPPRPNERLIKSLRAPAPWES